VTATAATTKEQWEMVGISGDLSGSGVFLRPHHQAAEVGPPCPAVTPLRCPRGVLTALGCSASDSADKSTLFGF